MMTTYMSLLGSIAAPGAEYLSILQQRNIQSPLTAVLNLISPTCTPSNCYTGLNLFTQDVVSGRAEDILSNVAPPYLAICQPLYLGISSGVEQENIEEAVCRKGATLAHYSTPPHFLFQSIHLFLSHPILNNVVCCAKCCRFLFLNDCYF